MKKFCIWLCSIDQVKSFVNDMNGIEGDVILSAGRYVIDAKSIMGIFSLDLSKPLTLEFEHWNEAYAAIVAKYVAA